MHSLASNSKHSHGVEGNETEDTTVLWRSVFTVIVVSSAPKALWVVMYTMNNHTMRCKPDNQLVKHCIEVV